MLKGVGASAGIGIGNVLVLEDISLEYTPHEVTDTAAETTRFKDAVDRFIKNTEKQAKKLLETTGEKEARILEGHISMINDPYMQSEIEKQIASGTCAEEALENMCNMFIGVFSAADDDFTRQRAADVRDVKTGVLGELLGVKEIDLSEVPADTVLVTRELTPSMTAGIKKENIAGIITETGGKTSHSAILARALEIPAVLSVPDISEHFKNEDKVIVDGTAGNIILDPDKKTLAEYTAMRENFIAEKNALEVFRGKKTLNADGKEYELFCNIGKPEDAVKTVECDGEGVGLFRTEFLFMDRTSLPNEEEQFEAYKKAAIILKGKPLIIRTLDIGGDKEIEYLGLEKEENPFMGYRAIRYCIGNKELFKTQIRAILRASVYGDVRIMFPLVTCIDEVRQGKRIVEECKAELKLQGKGYNNDIKVGIMTETAAAAVIADLLAKECDFFSIGTNDLTGYTMSCDRGNDKVSYLYSHFQPAVLRMIEKIIKSANEQGIPVGMCGEAAADPMLIPILISFGLTEFSVSPVSTLKVRKEIAKWTKEKADEITAHVMSLKTQGEVAEYLKTQI